ncbi:MAG: hypothetical protein ACP5C3_06540 [Methanomicrobiales archaeon]
MAGFAVGVVLLPFINDTIKKLNFKEQIIVFIPLVSFICLCYELVGYYLFYIYKPYLSLLYQDTIHDLSMNILGAIIAFIILLGLNIKKGQKLE